MGEHMDEFVHTSELESVNSLILKYTSKRYSYSWIGMLIRHTLAVLDYNSNIQRGQKVSKDGQGMFKKKVDRTGTKATVVQQKVEKDRRYQDNILDLCVQCLDTGLELIPEYPIDEEVLKTRKHSFDKAELVDT